MTKIKKIVDLKSTKVYTILVENNSTEKEVKDLYNGELLKAAIEKSGVKLKFIALRLGISPYGLKLKLDGVNEFKNSEMIALSELLKLSCNDREKIFFGL